MWLGMNPIHKIITEVLLGLKVHVLPNHNNPTHNHTHKPDYKYTLP